MFNDQHQRRRKRAKLNIQNTTRQFYLKQDLKKKASWQNRICIKRYTVSMEAKKKNLVKWTQLVVQSNECHCVIFKYIHALDKRSQIINFFLRKKKTLFIYFLLSICSICLSKFMYTMYMQVSMDAREGWIPPELESCACELPHVHAINRTQSSAKALLINFLF